MAVLITRSVLSDDAVTVRSAGFVSASPTVKGITAVWTSSFVVLLVMEEIVGASFSSITVTSKLVLDPAVPSLTVSVIVTGPPL